MHVVAHQAATSPPCRGITFRALGHTNNFFSPANKLEHAHLLVRGWDGNVDAVVVHETANLAAFLADDVAMEFIGHKHFHGHRDQVLQERGGGKRMDKRGGEERG